MLTVRLLGVELLGVAELTLILRGTWMEVGLNLGLT